MDTTSAPTPRTPRLLTRLGLVALALGALLAVLPITANSGIFGSPQGDGGPTWCGALIWQRTDCHGCCTHAGVYQERLVGVITLCGFGLVVLACSAAARRRSLP